MVSITSTQVQDGEEYQIQTKQPGVYKYLQGKHVIKYEEYPEDEPEGQVQATRCILKIAEGTASLVKKGSIETQMVFQKNHSDRFLYDTPMGSMNMYVHTSHVELEEQEDLLSLCIRYSLSINHTQTTDCTIQIDVQML